MSGFGNSHPHSFSPEDQQMPAANYSGNFYSKVILSFGLALLTSAAGTYTAFNFLAPLLNATPGLIWLFYGLELLLVFTSRMWSARRPLNYLLFALFAFLSGLTVAPLLAGVLMQTGGPELIIKALVASTCVFGATAVFGWTTNRNLSGMGGFLWMGLITMVILSVIGIFIPWGNTFEIIFSGFGILLFSGYTMYDIQRLKSYDSNQYIDAALQLYLDMFNIFIFIVRLMSGISRD